MSHVECANCDWTGDEGAALGPLNIWSRLEPGDEFPAGDCPECGCFVYLKEDV